MLVDGVRSDDGRDRRDPRSFRPARASAWSLQPSPRFKGISAAVRTRWRAGVRKAKSQIRDIATTELRGTA